MGEMKEDQGVAASPPGHQPTASAAVPAPSQSGVPNAESLPWLHIRGQFTYHFEATIRGTAAGLTSLRNAIDAAIAEGRGEADAIASDGEGYEVIVERSSTVSGIGKPTYLDEEARALAVHERDFLTRYCRSNRAVEKEAYNALRWCRANGNPHAQGIVTATADETADAGSVPKG